MSEKILILDRTKNTLEIQDGDNEFAFSYILSITCVEKDKTKFGTENRVVKISNKGISMGFVTHVKEIKEVWGK